MHLVIEQMDGSWIELDRFKNDPEIYLEVHDGSNRVESASSCLILNVAEARQLYDALFVILYGTATWVKPEVIDSKHD